MPNLYSCTNLNGHTAGTANKDLNHFQRTPLYYEYANSEAEAIEKVKTRFLTDDKSKLDFDAKLLRKNVAPPIKAEKAAGAGGAK